MAYFSPALASYIDATLGWDLDGYDTLAGVFAQYMPNWGPTARSYATQICLTRQRVRAHGRHTGALRGELRILAAIDLADGRSCAGWTTGTAPPTAATSTPGSAPRRRRFHRPQGRRGPDPAAPGLVDTCTTLHGPSPPGTPPRVHDLLHTDVVLVGHGPAHAGDRPHRDRRLPRPRAGPRALRSVQLAAPRRRRRGRRWLRMDGGRRHRGITEIECAGGLITGINSVYDSRRLEPDRKTALVAAAFAAVAGSGNSSPTGTPGIIGGIDHARSVEGA